jgi:hypothetical protein
MMFNKTVDSPLLRLQGRVKHQIRQSVLRVQYGPQHLAQLEDLWRTSLSIIESEPRFLLPLRTLTILMWEKSTSRATKAISLTQCPVIPIDCAFRNAVCSLAILALNRKASSDTFTLDEMCQLISHLWPRYPGSRKPMSSLEISALMLNVHDLWLRYDRDHFPPKLAQLLVGDVPEVLPAIHMAMLILAVADAADDTVDFTITLPDSSQRTRNMEAQCTV